MSTAASPVPRAVLEATLYLTTDRRFHLEVGQIQYPDCYGQNTAREGSGPQVNTWCHMGKDRGTYHQELNFKTEDNPRALPGNPRALPGASRHSCPSPAGPACPVPLGFPCLPSHPETGHIPGPWSGPRRPRPHPSSCVLTGPCLEARREAKPDKKPLFGPSCTRPIFMAGREFKKTEAFRPRASAAGGGSRS